MKICSNSINQFQVAMRAFAIGSVLALAACASKQPQLLVPPPVLSPWTDDRPLELQHGHVMWADTARERNIEIDWTVPRGRKAAALVVFLPALGESTRDANLLVDSIAAAGYAVVGIEHPGNDASVWQGDLARRAEFALIARGAFAPAPAAQRAADVRYVLDRIEREHPQWLAGVDDHRIALMGYDLGAHTAQLMAGEHMARSALPAGDPRIAALVLLDPYVGFTGPSMQERYLDIKLPLLTVFGANDSDAYGLGMTGTQRRSLSALAINAPVYELRLGGSAVRNLVSAQPERRSDAGRSRGSGEPPNRGRGRQGRGGQNGDAGSSDERGPDPLEPLGGDDGERSGESPRIARFAAFNSMVLGIRAFLDAELLNNRDARQWLDDRRPAPFSQWTHYSAGRPPPAALPR